MDLAKIPKIKNLDSDNFFLIAGPCVIESEKSERRLGPNYFTKLQLNLVKGV